MWVTADRNLRNLRIAESLCPVSGKQWKSSDSSGRISDEWGKGSSMGARVITYTICASESEGRVYLVDVYDKSDFSTVSVSILKKIISEQGII